MDAQPLLCRLASDIRRRAQRLRQLAADEEERRRDARDLASVLDQVADRVADGMIPPDAASDALGAAHWPDTFMATVERQGEEAARLRKAFGMAA